MACCNEKEKAAGVPMMMDGDALSFYAANVSGTKTFDEIVARLHQEYTSEEQRSRLLRDWQKTSLREEMRNHPEKSQVEVFRIVCRNLTKTQRQLHEDYHNDRFLRDQIIMSADLPEIEKSLREKVASTSQEATQRIAALLFSRPGSAKDAAYVSREDNSDVFYRLNRKFEGAARKPPRGIVNRKQRSGARIYGC
jgi:hypothetical protein